MFGVGVLGSREASVYGLSVAQGLLRTHDEMRIAFLPLSVGISEYESFYSSHRPA